MQFEQKKSKRPAGVLSHKEWRRHGFVNFLQTNLFVFPPDRETILSAFVYLRHGWNRRKKRPAQHIKWKPHHSVDSLWAHPTVFLHVCRYKWVPLYPNMPFRNWPLSKVSSKSHSYLSCINLPALFKVCLIPDFCSVCLFWIKSGTHLYQVTPQNTIEYTYCRKDLSKTFIFFFRCSPHQLKRRKCPTTPTPEVSNPPRLMWLCDQFHGSLRHDDPLK